VKFGRQLKWLLGRYFAVLSAVLTDSKVKTAPNSTRRGAYSAPSPSWII